VEVGSRVGPCRRLDELASFDAGSCPCDVHVCGRIAGAGACVIQAYSAPPEIPDEWEEKSGTSCRITAGVILEVNPSPLCGGEGRGWC